MSKFISSSIWNFIANFFIRLMSIATFPFLVRFYLREDIAVFKSFQSYVLILMVIIPIGTNILYLSQGKEERKQRWNLFFYTSFLISFVMVLALAFIPEITAFFVDGNIRHMRTFMVIVPLIEACKVIIITKLSSNMDFKDISIALIVKQLFLYASIIIFAMINPTLLVLLIMVLLSEMIELLILFSQCIRKRNSLLPKLEAASSFSEGKISKLKLWLYSLRIDKQAKKYIACSGIEQIFISFATQFPVIFAVIVLGRTLAPEFQLPFAAVTLPVTLVMRSVARVAFPHFSNLRDDDKIISSLFSILFPITFILFPVMAAIHFFAHELTYVFFEADWNYAVFSLRIFPVLMIAYMLNMPSSYISNIKGKPYINLIYAVFLFSARIAGIWFGNKLGGFAGTILLFSLGDFIVRFIRLNVDIKLLSLSVKRYFQCIRYNFYSLLVLACLMWSGYLTLHFITPEIAVYQIKIISFIIAFTVSILLNYKWEKERLKEVVGKIKGELTGKG